MRTSAKVGSGPLHTTESVLAQPVDHEIVVPLKEIDNGSAAGIALGFRQPLFTMHRGDEEVASVESTGGFGGVAVMLSFGDRTVAFDSRVLLARWVATFDPQEADKLAEAMGVERQ